MSWLLSSHLGLAGMGWLLNIHYCRQRGSGSTDGEGSPAGTEAHGVCPGLLFPCNRAAWPWERGQWAADPAGLTQGAPGTAVPRPAPSDALPCLFSVFSNPPLSASLTLHQILVSPPPAFWVLPLPLQCSLRGMMYALGCFCSLRSTSHSVPWKRVLQLFAALICKMAATGASSLIPEDNSASLQLLVWAGACLGFICCLSQTNCVCYSAQRT